MGTGCKFLPIPMTCEYNVMNMVSKYFFAGGLIEVFMCNYKITQFLLSTKMLE